VIGKYKYGKVVLSNGQAGVFYLELLIAKDSGARWPF
jgi:hypothetical protein